MPEETLAWGFPDLGRPVLRPSVLDSLSARPEAVKVLSAPSGYGKTVAALQYALHSGFDRAIWVDVGRQSPASQHLLRSVVAALNMSIAPSQQSPGSAPTPTDVSDLIAAMQAVGSPALRVCLVLDDVSLALPGIGPQLAVFEKAVESMRGRLVLTTRDQVAIEDLEHAQYVDAERLRLSLSEAASIAESDCADTMSVDRVEAAWRASGGHAAFFVVLSRDERILSEGNLGRSSLDLDALLSRVIRAHLDTDGERALAAMSMLAVGSADDLQAVGVNPASIAAVARVLPLVHVSDDAVSSFRVHDIVQSSVLGLESVMVHKRDLGPRIVTQLVHRGEIQRALDLVSRVFAGSELAEWLEAHGQEALAAGFGASTRRLLSTLSLRELIERPRLLLLQASLLFSAGALGEAATKARVVSTMATSTGDRRLALDAMSLAAGIHREAGQLGAAAQTLVQLIQSYGDVMAPDEKAHAFASLSSLSLYEGDAEATQRWMRCAEKVLDEEGLTGDAAAVALESVGASVAIVRGRYSETARFFSQVSTAKGIDLRARTLALGNAAASLCEIGRLDRCIESCRQALDYAAQLAIPIPETDMNFRPIISAARIGLGDPTAITGMAKTVSAPTEYPFMTGTDYNRIYFSTCLRSLGHLEESLRSS